MAGEEEEAKYSEKYQDDTYEYRHVILTEKMRNDLFKRGWKGKILEEAEWRSLGVTQSRGWQHYAIHKPEPHILLFRRLLGTNPVTGMVEEALRLQAVAEYNKQQAAEERRG